MKLKEGFITREMDGEQIMIAVGNVKFAGLVRSNETAAFIVDSLKTETTKEEIVQKMLAQYDASRSEVSESVDRIVEKLKSIGAIDE